MRTIKYKVKRFNQKGVQLDLLDEDDNVLEADLKFQLRFKLGKVDFDYIERSLVEIYLRGAGRSKVTEKIKGIKTRG